MFEVGCMLPLWLVLNVDLYEEGELTVAESLRTAGIALCIFAVAGLLLWATFLEPYVRGIEKKHLSQRATRE